MIAADIEAPCSHLIAVSPERLDQVTTLRSCLGHRLPDLLLLWEPGTAWTFHSLRRDTFLSRLICCCAA